MSFPSKIAVVTDSLLGRGGADRVLLSILDMFPDAIVYTSSANRSLYPDIKNEIRTSFLDNKVLKRFVPRHINILTPIAFESFDLRGFDLVITLSAGSSKGVITQIDQDHVLIILTPPRHQWDKELNSRSLLLRRFYGFAANFTGEYLRIWDSTAIKRADHLISISKYIQNKAKKIYRRDSDVIYPGASDFWYVPVTETDKKKLRNKYNLPEDFALVVSRFFDHKKVDWAIKAALKAGKNLVIVGTGPDFPHLKRTAGKSSKIKFLGFLSDEELRLLYNLADVFIFPGVEDFGLTPIESMAAGTPVLAYNKGGLTETVKAGVSGDFFETIDELSEMLREQRWKEYDREEIIAQANLFTEERFKQKFMRYLETLYGKRKGK